MLEKRYSSPLMSLAFTNFLYSCFIKASKKNSLLSCLVIAYSSCNMTFSCREPNAVAPGCSDVSRGLEAGLQMNLDPDRELQRIHSLFIANMDKLTRLRSNYKSPNFSCFNNECYFLGVNERNAVSENFVFMLCVLRHCHLKITV